MKKLKIILAALVIVFVAIQFIRPARNHSEQANQQSLEALYHPPDSVAQILKVACMDCHSNNTRYPWYANIQPVAWMLDRHIRHGKDELNLDEFGDYPSRRQKSKLRSMKNQISDGTMPLKSYKLIHTDARLSDGQKEQLTQWLNQKIDSLEQN